MQKQRSSGTRSTLSLKSKQSNFNIYNKDDASFFNKVAENSVYSNMKSEASRFSHESMAIDGNLLRDLEFSTTQNQSTKKRRRKKKMSYSRKQQLINQLINTQHKLGYWKFNSNLLKEFDTQNTLLYRL
jgi:hypothetical protein